MGTEVDTKTVDSKGIRMVDTNRTLKIVRDLLLHLKLDLNVTNHVLSLWVT